MAGELIIDVCAHVFQTAGLERQGKETTDASRLKVGDIDTLRAITRKIGIEHTVITTVIPIQPPPSADLQQPASTFPRERRELAPALREQLLQRLDVNNLRGCDIGRAYPEFLPFITIDPILMDAVRIRQRVREAVSRGARGIALFPNAHGFFGNDRRAWPIYEMAQSFKLPILAQTGDGGPLPAGGRGHWGRPRYFGDVAASFPRLQLILGQLGKGYESEIAVLTRRYRNVYTETSARLTGLDEVGRWTAAEAVTWFRLIGIDRILLGTQWPLFDPCRVIEAIRTLSLSPEEKRKILGENAKRVLQL